MPHRNACAQNWFPLLTGLSDQYPVLSCTANKKEREKGTKNKITEI
jgi:hypothetical protein